MLPVPRRVVVPATITGIVTDDGDQRAARTVHDAGSQGRRTPSRDVIVQMTLDRGRADSLVIIGGVNPPRVVVGVPAPQVIAHRAVQGSGTAVGETTVVRRVKLTPATVNGHEVAAQTDHGGKIPQEIDITVSLADWRALTTFPATDSDVLVHDRYRVGERDLNRLARFLGHSLDQILGGLVRVGQGQLVDCLAVIEGRDDSAYLLLLCCC